MALSWLLLMIAGALEVVWAAALKRSDGMRKPRWAVAGFGVAAVSLLLLSAALRELPLGLAYAAWVGIGAFGVALVGSIAFGEQVTRRRAACLLAIATGIVGLKALGG